MMTVSKKAPRYSGKLAKPIVHVPIARAIGLRVVDRVSVEKANEEFARLREEALLEELAERIVLLMRHYRIEDEANYFGLAVALARDHVPGFSINPNEVRLSDRRSGAVEAKTRIGRPRIWTGERLLQLLENVEDIKRERKIAGDRDALKVLARRQWKPAANHRGGHTKWLETLESRLHDAKEIRRNALNILNIFEKIRSKQSA